MSTRYCTQCGAEVVATDKFCTACGAEMEQTTTPEAAAPPVQTAPSAKSRAKFPMIALSLLGIVAVIAAAFAVYQATTDTAPSVEEIVARQAAEGLPYPDVLRISADDAKARLDAEAAIFVDVRDQESFATAHVPGAVLLPLTEFETGYAQLPQDAEIITYCT